MPFINHINKFNFLGSFFFISLPHRFMECLQNIYNIYIHICAIIWPRNFLCFFIICSLVYQSYHFRSWYSRCSINVFNVQCVDRSCAIIFLLFSSNSINWLKWIDLCSITKQIDKKIRSVFKCAYLRWFVMCIVGSFLSFLVCVCQISNNIHVMSAILMAKSRCIYRRAGGMQIIQFALLIDSLCINGGCFGNTKIIYISSRFGKKSWEQSVALQQTIWNSIDSMWINEICSFKWKC